MDLSVSTTTSKLLPVWGNRDTSKVSTKTKLLLSAFAIAASAAAYTYLTSDNEEQEHSNSEPVTNVIEKKELSVG